MLCRCCGMDCLGKPADLPDDRGIWRRCLGCGSESNENSYEQIRDVYSADYIYHNQKLIGFSGCVREHATNVIMFDNFRKLCPDDTFLDIGCLDGGGMAAMAAKGWAVHGFDVIPHAKEISPPGEHVTIAPEFAANLFPRKYAAVLAREVIEHLPKPLAFLVEAKVATMPGGLFQIQTPRPSDEDNRCGRFHDHLQLFSPFVLRTWLEQVGFKILDQLLWPIGQLWICQNPA